MVYSEDNKGQQLTIWELDQLFTELQLLEVKPSYTNEVFFSATYCITFMVPPRCMICLEENSIKQ